MSARLTFAYLSRRRPLATTRNLATARINRTRRMPGTGPQGFHGVIHPYTASFTSVRKLSGFPSSSSEDTFEDRDDIHFSHQIGEGHAEIDGNEQDGSSGPKRIWMDPESPLDRRVGRFVNQPLGSIHHLDIKLTSVDLIRECGKQNSFEGMKNAQDILDRIIEEKKYLNEERIMSPIEKKPPSLVIVPDRPFKMVMYGWANMCEKVKFAPERMREVLDSMIEEADYDKSILQQATQISARIRESVSTDDIHGDDSEDEDLYEGFSCEPNVDIYNTLLQGLSQAASRSIQAAIEAEHVLKRMEKMHRNRGWHTKPNTRSFSLVLNAYTKSKHATAGDRAESVLRRMIERHEVEKQEYFEEYGVEYDTMEPEHNKRKIVTPDTIAYTTVIQAHVNSGSSASPEKALMLLNEVIDSDSPALEPDAFAFATTINAFSKMAAQKKSPKERTEAAECAEDILWMMVEEMKNNPETNRLSGSIVPFNTCLNAWAQSFTPESPNRADSLLHRMLDPELQNIAKIHPNTVSFNTCMQAWAKACKFQDSAAPEKAEDLLDLLIQLSMEGKTNSTSKEDGNPHPDVRSFVTVMNAYALSGREDSVFHTRRLLSKLLQGPGIYFGNDKKNKINASPFTIIFKAAAGTKAKNDDADEANLDDFALGSLDETEDETETGLDPYSTALKTYSELLNDPYNLGVSPDHFAFAGMLDVIGRHTSLESIERRQRLEEVFHDARQAGQVSSLVVRALQKASPNDTILRELLRLRGHDSVVSIESINRFPRQWTMHVPPEFRRVSGRNEHFQKQSKHFRDAKAKKSGGRSTKQRSRKRSN